MKEEWRPIKSFPGYEVSNLGRVRSYKRLSYRNSWQPNLLSSSLDPHGYFKVTLYRDKGHYIRYVYYLVLTTFVGPRPEGYQCNHKDGDRNNNTLDNLEWVTPLDNWHHAWRLGLISDRKGEHANNANLKDGEVWLIKKLLYHRVQTKMICKMFRISWGHLYKIKIGENWGHIKFNPEVTT
jgi:hypothetical protein